MLPVHLGDLTTKPERFFGGKWKKRLRDTRDYLVEKGFGAVHFDSHCPAPYDRESFLRVMTEHDWRTRKMTINTLYFNAAVIPGQRNASLKTTLESPIHDAAAIRQRLAGATFLGYNDAGLTDALKSVLAEMFPEKSPFEADEFQPAPKIEIIRTPADAPIPWTKFLNYEDLARDSIGLVKKIPQEVDCIVGAARSGLMPAAMIATKLHLPLFAVSKHGVTDPGHGNRMNGRDDPCAALRAGRRGHGLDRQVDCDDRRAGCQALAERDGSLRPWFTRPPAARPSVTWSAESTSGRTFWSGIFPTPGSTRTWRMTLTGYFARIVRPGADDDGQRYEEFLRNAVPKYLPRKYPVRLIITARLEKWRPQTEDWLRRHGIAWKELAMGPWPSLEARRRDRDIDKFKAYVLAHSTCYGFVESDVQQAKSIMQLARKPVLCPAAKEFFIPPRYNWKKMSRGLR